MANRPATEPQYNTAMPQSGPQDRFLKCGADIAVYGGAAGGGKTWALLMEAARFSGSPGWEAVTFRRTTPQITAQGGLWDGASQLYPAMKARPVAHRLEWRWPAGGRTRFAHLEHRDTVYDWQGAQVPLICFDELTHFESSQFWYMLSRVRSLRGFPGRMRATTNPDCDSWVFRLVEWYIGDDGYPIPERAGSVRWFARDGDNLVWGDSAEQLREVGDAMSFAFIPAKLEDNKALTDVDPGYSKRLNLLSYVDRMRLRWGNWKVRARAGTMFRREWFDTVDAYEATGSAVRYWDRAATKPRPGKTADDPDWTAGVKMRRIGAGQYVIEDVRRFRDTPLGVQRSILATAKQDGPDVTQVLEQDPGQAGVGEAATLVRMLEGFSVRVVRPTADKVSRAKPVSAQCEARNVAMLRGSWNDALLTELENFPEWSHDDQVDALSGAFNALVSEARVLV